jgi:hypothetical protein
MPKYHFDLVDHVTVQDKGGQELIDDITASYVADELAKLVYLTQPELRDRGYAIQVSDEGGIQIYKVGIDEFSTPPLAPVLH